MSAPIQLLAAMNTAVDRHGWAQRLGDEHVECTCGWSGTYDGHRSHRHEVMAHAAAEFYDRVLTEATGLCWKATPGGYTEDGDVAMYLLPKGAVHRLVGALQCAGVSASLRNADTTPIRSPEPDHDDPYGDEDTQRGDQA